MLPLGRFAFRPKGVQNCPNCVTKVRRNWPSVLADHVSVDRLRDWRAISVAKSLLTQFLRCSETAHQSCVRMTERVEAVPRDIWTLGTLFFRLSVQAGEKPWKERSCRDLT